MWYKYLKVVVACSQVYHPIAITYSVRSTLHAVKFIPPTGSGAVTKEDFEKLFNDTPTISDAHSEMTKLEAGLGDPKTDWSTHLILVGGLHLHD